MQTTEGELNCSNSDIERLSNRFLLALGYPRLPISGVGEVVEDPKI